MRSKLFLATSAAVLLFSLQGFSQSRSATPSCLAGGQELLLNNETVLNWKATSKNQYRNRAHILGTLVKDLPDHSGHHHYEVQIGANQNDLIEVIYNEQFGAVPAAEPGTQFEACGDYITSNAPAGHFPASPDGAIVHWVHRSPNPKSHDSGFLVVNGVVCGQNTEAAGPKH